jgi:glycine/D-amino acid oxidase-like deaminating enzyme
MQTHKKIAVVGSGLVGSLLAIYLRKAGHTVYLRQKSRYSKNTIFRSFDQLGHVK